MSTPPNWSIRHLQMAPHGDGRFLGFPASFFLRIIRQTVVIDVLSCFAMTGTEMLCLLYWNDITSFRTFSTRSAGVSVRLMRAGVPRLLEPFHQHLKSVWEETPPLLEVCSELPMYGRSALQGTILQYYPYPCSLVILKWRIAPFRWG